MEDNFRNALIILSGVVIAAIFIHGLWTIRKQKNPYKLKASKDQVKPLSRDFDGKGFDQDGVGKIKVIKKNNEPEVNSEEDFEQIINLEGISHLNDDQRDDLYNELSSQEHVEAHGINIFSGANDIENEKHGMEEIKLAPIYAQPVTQAKPDSKKTTPKKTKNVSTQTKSASQIAAQHNEIETNFGDALAFDEQHAPTVNFDNVDKNSSQPLSPQKTLKNKTIEPQIIILSVVMPMNQLMPGVVLLPTLLTLGLKFGEMNIFHRHQDNAGTGAVTFSLANMMNPGSFDLDTMETFATKGVSLFMALPNASDPFAVFEQMLAAAKQLAKEFNAQLLDDKRNVMTKQIEQDYVAKIHEFERDNCLTRVV